MFSRFRMRKKISIIPNGIDLTDFYYVDKREAREELKLDIEEKIVLFVSNPERPEKNYSLAQSACRLCNYSIRLLTVDNIPTDKLKYYYSAADALVLTSLHEGSPNVVKEAMTCNCPVVSTDVGNVKWLFGGIDGYYLTSFAPDDIALNLKRAIDFKQKNNQTMGRDRIIALELDSETVADKIINVYNKVLDIEI